MQQRHLALFENSLSAITFLSEQSTIQEVNPAFCHLLGYTPGELLGRPLADFVHPGDADKLRHLQQLLASHTAQGFSSEKRYVHKDGSIIWGQQNFTAIYQPEISASYGIEIITDLREQKKMEQHLGKTLATLKDRNFELDQFVYKVSHDLRSPLTTILGLVNLIKDEQALVEIHHYVDLVGNRVLKLDSFLQTMLHYLKNTRQKVHYERIYFEDLLAECLADLEYVKNFTCLRISWAVTGSEFYSDPLRLKIIFQNLISNAIKYQDYHKPERFLHIRMSINDQGAEFVFEDNGVGMTPEHIQSITKMFFRASDQSDGSGLGMYIVQQAVERLKGSIHIESPGGKGMVTRIVVRNGKPRIEKEKASKNDFGRLKGTKGEATG